MSRWVGLPLVAAMATAGGLSAVFAGYVWRRREAVGSRSLALVLVAAAVWSLAYAFELHTPDLTIKQSWGDAKYVGIGLLAPAWLAFVLEYTARRRWLRPGLVAALAVEPLVVLALLAHPASHDLVRYYAPGVAGLPLVRVGPVFWPHLIYTNVLLLAATGMFVVSLVRMSRVYRRQSVVLLAAVAVPWTANLLHNLAIGPFALVDLTPVGFCLLGVVLVWGVFRFRLLDLAPVARAQVFERMRDGIVVLDTFQRVVDLNPSAEQLLATPRNSAIGRPARQLLPGGDALWDEPLATPLSHELRIDEESAGDAQHLQVTVSSLGDRGGRAGLLVVLSDITDRKLAEQRLEQLAFRDPLTALPNRQLFLDRLTHELSRARRHGNPLAVLFVDLDDFKQVNDTLGHDGGDELLKRVARRLSEPLRDADTVARFGGDEFAVLLPEIADPRDAALVAVRLLDALAAPFVVDGRVLDIGASLGVSVFPDDGPDPETLIRHADQAMYQAKAEGKNRFSFDRAATPRRV